MSKQNHILPAHDVEHPDVAWLDVQHPDVTRATDVITKEVIAAMLSFEKITAQLSELYKTGYDSEDVSEDDPRRILEIQLKRQRSQLKKSELWSKQWFEAYFLDWLIWLKKDWKELFSEVFDEIDSYREFLVCKKNWKYFIYKKNWEKTDLEFDFFGSYPDVNWGRVYTKKWNLGQVFNENFELIFSCECDTISPLDSCNGTSFTKDFKISRNWKYWVISDKWAEIVPCEYDEIYLYNKTYYEVKQNWKYWILDENWKEIISCKYDDISKERGFNGYIVYNDNSDWLLDKAWNVIQETWIYKQIKVLENSDSEVWILFKVRSLKSNKYWILGEDLVEIIPCEYKSISNCSLWTFVVSDWNWVWVLGENWKTVIIPLKYDKIYLNIEDTSNFREKESIHYVCVKWDKAYQYNLAWELVGEEDYIKPKYWDSLMK